MRVDVVPVQDLSADHERQWREIRATHRVYSSPFYALDFVRIAARSRPCFVAIIEDEGRVVGFWPFERHPWWVAAPVGHPAADHHGPLVAMNWEPSPADARKLLRATGKHLYRFTALPAEQRLWRRYQRHTEGSAIVVLEKYQHASTSSNSNLGRKLRRLSREVGNWSFDIHCADRAVFEQLITWKRAHCVRTGFPDLGADPSRLALLHDLFEARTPELRSHLSVLRAGDKVIAAHFGLLSERVWHWWYPSYDTEMERHSPGLLMLHQMLAIAPALNVEWLDFGKGDESFKWQFANDKIDVATGTVYSTLAGIPVWAKQVLKGMRSKPAAEAALPESASAPAA